LLQNVNRAHSLRLFHGESVKIREKIANHRKYDFRRSAGFRVDLFLPIQQPTNLASAVFSALANNYGCGVSRHITALASEIFRKIQAVLRAVFRKLGNTRTARHVHRADLLALAV